MLEIRKISNIKDKDLCIERDILVSFLHQHLERFRDDQYSISAALDYIADPLPGKGGFVLLAFEDAELAGVLVMLKTGMSDFVPQNLLVYLAVAAAKRGKGIGHMLIEEAKKNAEGDIALHVEPDNPAIHLYEREGFASKYVEMRWKR